jgi:hypothetical protein
LVGGQTTSLCLPDAARDFRGAMVGVHDRPVFVLLASDGYGNSFAEPDWAIGVARDLIRAFDRDGVGVVARNLPAWLRESAQAGGDDVTVAALTRRAAPAAPVGTRRAAPVVVAPAAVGRATPPQRPLSRLPVVVLLLATVALVAFALGYMVRGGGGSPTPSSTTTSVAGTTIPQVTAATTVPTAGGGGGVGGDSTSSTSTPG